MFRSRLAVASRLLGSLALPSLVLLGCTCEEDKPYTPFEVASTLPGTSPSAPPSVSAAPVPSAPEQNPTLRRALKAPRNATTWKTPDQTYEAPAGQVFELGLPLTKPDGSSAFVAWTVRKSQKLTDPAGALWLYAGGAPRQLTPLPGFVPTGPDCTLEADLAQTGPQTVTLDVASRCTSRLVQRMPTRAVLVLAPERPEPVLMGFRVADAAPGELLRLTIDSRDADGDGRDDVTLRVTGGSSGFQGSPVPFVWLERAAGRSRESLEPAAELNRLAKRLVTRAKNKKSGSEVPQEANELRRLVSSACAESGTPRLWELDGAPLTCNATSALATALEAEIEAALTLGRPLDALGALSRDGWYGRLSEKDRARIESRIRERVRTVNAKVRGSFDAALPARDPAVPRWAPVWFDRQKRLWVLDGTNVRQSDPPGAPLQGAPVLGAGGAGTLPAAPAAWSLRVQDPNGRAWSGAIPSCDRSEVQLAFVARDGKPLPPLPTPLLSPRPGNCGRLDGRTKGLLAPIAWHGVDLEAWVFGARFGEPQNAAAAAAPPPGSPVSADGALMVLSTPLGLAVVKGRDVELWQGDAVRGLEECVVSEGGSLLACVNGSRVVVLERPAP